MESGEDWINFDSKLYIRNTKDAKDFDLYVATDREFDPKVFILPFVVHLHR